MTDLKNMKCVPCESDVPPMTEEEIEEYQENVPEWAVVDVDGVPHLIREFSFKNFAEALAFTDSVGAAAEEEGHHPVIELTWGRATVQWWTHNIEGLHQNDFIMAAKTDEIFKSDFE
ncbi:4a-hydroxytetrahydrobiopterin dehydratase [bacterium]|nr:4a-hydroxytetrahydrobiopterin dehydratase [bacterium]